MHKLATFKLRRSFQLVATFVIGILITITLAMLLGAAIPAEAQDDPDLYLPVVAKEVPPVHVADYVLLGWNDLGMHCYNRDFQDLGVLPPYNTLWAQVIKRGNPPIIMTDTITVTYRFPDNTYSIGKSNFWTYARQLFGVDLAPDMGLAGFGMAGEMEAKADHFVAEGIPLTEFSDSNPTVPDPYQLAELVALGAGGKVLAQNTVVAPVSTEMRCDNCHSDGGVEGVRTGRVETNILTLHDEENADEYPAGHTGRLMDRRPVLCAECHASNALNAPGVAGVPNLSKAMHKKHAGKVPQTTDGCYNCHPGPTTKCLRDVMSSRHGMTCVDCHGNMEKVAENSNPWLNEPRCDDCHKESQYAQDQPLYRMSTGHGGVRCEGCHDSTHAIATSMEARDAIKFVNLQGKPGTLSSCLVCHTTTPAGDSPHTAP